MSSNYPDNYWDPSLDPTNPEYDDRMKEVGALPQDTGASGSDVQSPMSELDGNVIRTQSYVTSKDTMPSWLKVDPNTGDQQGPDTTPTWPGQGGASTQNWARIFRQEAGSPQQQDAFGKYLDFNNRRQQHEEERSKFRKDWVMPALMLFAAARPQRWGAVRQVLEFMQSQKADELRRSGYELEREGQSLATQSHWANMEEAARNKPAAAGTPIFKQDDAGRLFRIDPNTNSASPVMEPDTDVNYDVGPQQPGQQKQFVGPKTAKAAPAPHFTNIVKGGKEYPAAIPDPNNPASAVTYGEGKLLPDRAKKTGDAKADALWTRVYNNRLSHPGTNIDEDGNPNDDAKAVARQEADAAVDDYKNRGTSTSTNKVMKRNAKDANGNVVPFISKDGGKTWKPIVGGG